MRAADALFRTADNLRAGLADYGAGKRQDAEMALVRAKTEFDVGRQRAADTRADEELALRRPALQLESDMAARQAEIRNAPLTHDSLLPEELRLAGEESDIAQHFGRVLGATRGPDGIYRKQDGTPLTQAALEDPRVVQQLSGAVLGYLDPDISLADVEETANEAISSGALEGEALEAAKRRLAWVQGVKKDPAKLYDARIKALESIGDKERLARVVAERNAYVEAQREEAKDTRKFGQEAALAQYREAGALQRANITAAALRDRRGYGEGKDDLTRRAKIAEGVASVLDQDSGEMVVDQGKAGTVLNVLGVLVGYIDPYEERATAAALSGVYDTAHAKALAAGANPAKAVQMAQAEAMAWAQSVLSGGGEQAQAQPTPGPALGQNAFAGAAQAAIGRATGVPLQGAWGGPAVAAPAPGQGGGLPEIPPPSAGLQRARPADPVYGGDTSWSQRAPGAALPRAAGQAVSGGWNNFTRWARMSPAERRAAEALSRARTVAP
jgi:hypothetical protein